MTALILNSGTGSRMGGKTKHAPKCMSVIAGDETIFSMQIKMLQKHGIKKFVITTGAHEQVLVDYAKGLFPDLDFTFVYNKRYHETNYIYSIHLARNHLDDDILMLHGDLVFDESVLSFAMQSKKSCVWADSKQPLPQKDFKAVTENGVVKKIGVEFFENAVACQPLYMLFSKDWSIWLGEINTFCSQGQTSVYAENAFNRVSEKIGLTLADMPGGFCREIDTPEDLEEVRNILRKNVYMCMSTDYIHGGHINIIQKAAELGNLTIGVLTDEVVASHKRFPMLSYDERAGIIENIKGVSRVIPQLSLSYKENLRSLKPDILVHGDDWVDGIQKGIRAEAIEILGEYGGKLIEFPYSKKDQYDMVEEIISTRISLPDVRRGRLRKLLGLKNTINAIEAHSGLTGLIAEKTTVTENGKVYQFDAMWVSSLCDSAAKGKPDIELVDMTSRFRTIDDIMEVTTKPIIFDGDTGGLTEHFVYTIKTLERMGVSAVIIEDKTGLKKNSLFGTEAAQTQDSIESFCEKIKAGKSALKTKEFMLIARIESLILEKGMDDALNRAFCFVDAGADGIMIHSRRKEPDEIFEFCKKFRAKNKTTPLVVVPTSFHAVTEQEFEQHGVNIVIYANQLIRSAFPAMRKTAETILRHRRAKEADELCMPFQDIINLIPEG